MCAASQVGNLEVVKRLVERVANLDQGMRHELGCALAEAARAGHEKVCLFLIDADADVSAIPRGPRSRIEFQINALGRPLHEALMKKMGNVVRALLSAEVDVSYDYPITAIQAATKWGDHSIINDLILAGAPINTEPYYGIFEFELPLTIAVQRNDMELVRLFACRRSRH